MPTIITVSQLHRNYGVQTVLDDVSFALGERHRVGVIGRNGAGKSTLLRIILGQEDYDAGSVAIAPKARLAYLQQHDDFTQEESVQAYLERVTGKPGWRCAEVAARFQLGPERVSRPLGSLSGGFQTRAKLAAMLLQEPDFLVLDEPTNYLDLRTQFLLEGFLAGFQGGWLIVSHDRGFLQRTCTHTLELERGRGEIFDGTVDAYFVWKQARLQQAEHYNAGVEARRKSLEEFVARNRARASTAARAQSKMKELEKLETIAVDGELAAVTLALPSVETRQGTALRIKDLTIGYTNKQVAHGIEMEFERGEHIAVVGDNGQGKSTLLKTLGGELPSLSGGLQWGYGINIGCYAQHVYQAIPATYTVLQWLQKCADGNWPSQKILDIAGGFLFRGDAVEKKVAVLSGGERSRLCLAGLLLGKHQVLILDEPTNHLDVETVGALAEALSGFDGTLLFVSHDRNFTARVATVVVEVADGKALRFPGGYDAYLDGLTKEAAAMAKEQAGGSPGTGRLAKGGKDRHEQLKQTRARLRQAERRIAELDTERKQLEAQLVVAYDELGAARLAAILPLISAEEEVWVAASEELERG